MSSLNLTLLMGNLGAKPELHYTPTGRAVCTIRMATNDAYKDKNGQWQQHTEWHRVVVWGKSAEACAKNLDTGRLIHVEGRMQTRPWTDKEGRKHYTTEVVAKRVQFLPSGSASQKPVTLEVEEEAPAPTEEAAPAVKTQELRIQDAF